MSSFVVHNKLQKKISRTIFSGYYAPEKNNDVVIYQFTYFQRARSQ